MGIMMKFSVKCAECGHRNMPDRSPRRGVEKVLRGEFSACRKCGASFAKIRVPNRPLVQSVLAELPSISPAVEIVGYLGNTPKAYGYASV